mgnify:FL=1
MRRSNSTSFLPIGLALLHGLDGDLYRRTITKVIFSEVQTPFLTEVEVARARERVTKLWGGKAKEEPEKAIEAIVTAAKDTSQGGNGFT